MIEWDETADTHARSKQGFWLIKDELGKKWRKARFHHHHHHHHHHRHYHHYHRHQWFFIVIKWEQEKCLLDRNVRTRSEEKAFFLLHFHSLNKLLSRLFTLIHSLASIHSRIRSSIHSSIKSFVYWTPFHFLLDFNVNGRFFMIILFTQTLIHPFAHTLIHPFTQKLIHSHSSRAHKNVFLL